MDNEKSLLAYELNNMKEKQSQLEKKQESTEEILTEIRSGLTSIKDALTSSQEKEELKSKLLAKDIQAMKESMEMRVGKLETNQRWITTTVIVQILGIVTTVITKLITRGM